MKRLRFNEEKAAQVAAKVLGLGGGRMAYLKLIKLLYFIERAAILQWGRPVTTDRFVSMPHGPVGSQIYNLICMEPEETMPLSPWQKCIGRVDKYDVQLIRDPGDGELSRAESRLIADVLGRLNSKSKWELRDLSHDLPEWRDPAGSSTPLEIEDILRAEGRTDLEIETLKDEIASLAVVQLI